MVNLNLESDNSENIEELKTEIVSKRNQGEVLFEITKIIPKPSAASRSIQPSEDEDIAAVIDSFIRQQGCYNIGDRWREISKEEAEQILKFIMIKDLAYSVELMTPQEAQQISSKLLSIFTGNCKFFTNASFVDNYSGMSEWDSITESTFDTGVIIVSPDRIGMLWVKDED
ncbi:hypothetical protein NUACC21_25200 [Scytonema sp. NUACC21]